MPDDTSRDTPRDAPLATANRSAATAPEAGPRRVLVLAAHPSLEHSRVNHALMQAAARTATPASAAPAPSRQPAEIEVRDLYALYPDYSIDAQAEQAALGSAGLVVWLHPTHWYGMPPLMKLWCDEVLSFGWAYGEAGRALQGKHLWLVTTTGGAEDSYHPQGYNRYPFDAFLPPYEQTAALCGMRFLPPMVIHGAHRRTGDEIAADAQLFAERLRQWPDWPEIDETEACVACDVPQAERPGRAADDQSF